mmetsp:Transcript_75399/g.180086  ORF Transcript_75399/g.180086 Transcript_75399/m.180086 type:complete len:350 (-) Transcript_75399:219-1268(-)
MCHARTVGAHSRVLAQLVEGGGLGAIKGKGCVVDQQRLCGLRRASKTPAGLVAHVDMHVNLLQLVVEGDALLLLPKLLEDLQLLTLVRVHKGAVHRGRVASGFAGHRRHLTQNGLVEVKGAVLVLVHLHPLLVRVADLLSRPGSRVNSWPAVRRLLHDWHSVAHAKVPLPEVVGGPGGVEGLAVHLPVVACLINGQQAAPLHIFGPVVLATGATHQFKNHMLLLVNVLRVVHRLNYDLSKPLGEWRAVCIADAVRKESAWQLLVAKVQRHALVLRLCGCEGADVPHLYLGLRLLSLVVGNFSQVLHANTFHLHSLLLVQLHLLIHQRLRRQDPLLLHDHCRGLCHTADC